MNRLYVIGVGFRPLDGKAGKAIRDSSVILANDRIMEVFKGYDEYEAVRDKIRIINSVYETMEYIREAWRSGASRTVLLASGDPLFFGIGRMALKEFGKGFVEILPDLSSIQVAFSRIKEQWGEALFVSLHGGPDPAKRRELRYEIQELPGLLRRYGRLGILTDKVNNPSEIARVLHSSPLIRHRPVRMYVCERLGYPDERITEGTPEEIAGMTFSYPNVVIALDRGPEAPDAAGDDTRFGLREEEIRHTGGLITKDEVRAVAIHKLRLPRRGVFWDIGGGSGSVSIEAARMNPALRVFLIEKDAGRVEDVRANMTGFNVSNIELITGEAPEALEGLPGPDRVFVGGSGGRLQEIVEHSAEKGAERVVVNAATIETLYEALKALEARGFDTEVCEVSISRSKVINRRRHMSAHNPVFVITGWRAGVARPPRRRR